MSFAKKLMVSTIVLAASCITATAQDHAIKFTLAREVKVGSESLPAGHYRMAMYTTSHMLAIISPEGRDGRSVIAVPVSYASDRNCSETSLRFTQNASQLELSSVCLGSEEMAMYFPVSSKKKSEVAVKAPETAALAGAQ
ncbi:MAG TPA: hypothetical protein VG897_06420 [Terriglobales bacterium]|nr:hypothetical protein [Terriglobales bacterium]